MDRMVKFECTRCGRCCASFGEFIRVERQISPSTYICRFAVTGEIFQVHVQPGFADAFSDTWEDLSEVGRDDPPRKGCLFAQRNPEGEGFLCIIYPSRPTVCREFVCCRLIISDTVTGEERGRLVGLNDLRSGDPVLQRVWNDTILHLPHPLEPGPEAAGRPRTAAANARPGVPKHLAGLSNGMQFRDRQWMKTVMTILAEHGYTGVPVE